jgi:hypothetical protein
MVLEKSDLTKAYLDLMIRVVCNLIYEDPPLWVYDQHNELAKGGRFSLDRRVDGEDAPSLAHATIGVKRLENIQYCMESVLADDVPGEFLEAGVFRGGAVIFMRAVLRAYRISGRKVFACDAFMPQEPPVKPIAYLLRLLASPPSTAWRRRLFMWMQNFVPEAQRAFPVNQDPSEEWVDVVFKLVSDPDLMRSYWKGTGLENVKANFARYGLLDDQVVFVKGLFSDTLPNVSLETISVLRLDADSYESTMDVLNNLYPKLSPGGYCIVDDYHAFAECRRAIGEYRSHYSIQDEIIPIDKLSCYWRRAKG